MLNKTDQYFIDIVKYGNLNKAAEKLFVSQPSLTKYIQRLERQLGTVLFDRSTSPMRLNDAGKLYYQYLLTQESRRQQLMEQLNEINHLERGTLKLGMPTFAAQCYFPKVLQAFQARFPHVEVYLYENPGEYLEQALINQDIDLAILHQPVSHTQLIYEPVLSEEIILAVSKKKAAACTAQPDSPYKSIYEFRGLPFILPIKEQRLGQIVTDFLCTVDMDARILLRIQNVLTMLSLAALDIGATFVPAGILKSVSTSILNDLAIYHIYELEKSKMHLVALRRKETSLTPYASYFIQLMRSAG